MPKNKGKGGKNRRRGKNEGEEKRELVFKEHGQEYAQVRAVGLLWVGVGGVGDLRGSLLCGWGACVTPAPLRLTPSGF